MLNTTAESFLNVLRRFISRRGKPDLIWSDNATTFHLAEKSLELLTTPVKCNCHVAILIYKKLDVKTLIF